MELLKGECQVAFLDLWLAVSVKMLRMPLTVFLLMQGTEIAYGVTMARVGGGSSMPMFSCPK